MSADRSELVSHNDKNASIDEPGTAHNDSEGEEDEEGDDEDDEDDEPKLKYAKLTGSLSNVYRGGDSTSAFAIVGDKMVIGTHNGSIHVLAVPALQSLKTYRAHSASVTSVSISPTPPPPSLIREHGKTEVATLEVQQSRIIPGLARTNTSTSTSSPRTPQKGQQQQQTPVPNTPNNQIYVATSSLDGHVCVSSLVNPDEVLLRNFARPVNAVALSPDFKNDKTYLSGGLAGNLILTVGGKAGTKEDANTNSAAAAASGWLGAIGLGGNASRDTILHSGEGAISSIKWSLSGKWVVWVNEEGIKIMRSHLKLGSEDGEDAWKRIAHVPRANRRLWNEMAAVWRGRCEWIDDKSLEADDEQVSVSHVGANGTTPTKGKKRVEKLVVGWGDTAWILHVQSGSSTATSGNASGKRQIGSADIIHKMQFADCVIAGISLYTPSLLAVLAYRTRDDNDKPITSAPQTGTPRKGRQHRHTALAAQLRLVNVNNGEEVDLDELSVVSRFETLSAQDYHLGTLYQPPPLAEKTAREQRGRLEGLWEVAGGGYATRMFSSSASVLSGSSGGEKTTSSNTQRKQGSAHDVTATPELKKRAVDAHPFLLESGLKMFLMSPYDCILSVKRELADHLKWTIEHEQYGEAWNLIDRHPEAVDSSSLDTSSRASSPSKAGGSLADFFADESSSQASGAGVAQQNQNSAAQKEKYRVGDLWLQQLVSNQQWREAGAVAGKVLGTSSRWEHWVWTFAQADKFDEITLFIPSTTIRPPLPSLVYEVVLGHYIAKDCGRLPGLLDEWDPELFDVGSVISAIEDRLQSGDVSENSTEGGVEGRDWRMLMESLARLYLADGRAREALRAYVRLQDAEKVFSLIREEKLLDAVVDDIPGLLMLRITKEQLRSAPSSELEEGSAEAIQLLIDEAHRGTIPAESVIRQLSAKGDTFQLFLFFYLRALWNDTTRTSNPDNDRSNLGRGKFDRRIEEGHAIVNEHANLAVRLFAEYDRPLLLTFLKSSEVYSFDLAADICERRHYIPELVHVLGKMGQTKRALFLIIGELGDVPQAIGFAKENPDLWDDLLDYSMDKPTFIRGLLEEVGAANKFDPVDVVRRIPEGLEIEGLKHGIQRLVREFEIQMSISEGVARVLRGEVGMGMDTLRAGRKKGVRFEVVHERSSNDNEVGLRVHDPPTILPPGEEALPTPKRLANKSKSGVKGNEQSPAVPGRCVGCQEVFHLEEKEPLLGFACGHVYHLSCLLDANPDTRGTKEADDVMRQMEEVALENADDDGNAVGYGGRSVGAKVAHAHVVGRVVKGGCQRCGVVDGA
ncbi:unnamed protein product [Zymoseptoria tritici ST99CH_1A5]|uniref:Vps41 beta-propeller domain-containing protein n=1 Tax=Zymoseptoria tritici ST99CH_1A5 TaxID=1276529 RepID=A0A1Y6LYY2_ZYMTR|nr:unnamed protein product [Zymoseptoria tritici ST99CH_1A5]